MRDVPQHTPPFKVALSHSMPPRGKGCGKRGCTVTQKEKITSECPIFEAGAGQKYFAVCLPDGVGPWRDLEFLFLDSLHYPQKLCGASRPYIKRNTRRRIGVHALLHALQFFYVEEDGSESEKIMIKNTKK